MANQKIISRKTKLEDEQYKWGFELDIDSETAPKGINPEIIKFISKKKKEPEWMYEWRMKAYNHWVKKGDDEPTWANIKYPKINYQDILCSSQIW